jgi:hypothetical protein
MSNLKPKKAQSILEYIMVSIVFATVGVAAFATIGMSDFVKKSNDKFIDHRDKLNTTTLSTSPTNKLPGPWQGDSSNGNSGGGDPSWDTSKVIEIPEGQVGHQDRDEYISSVYDMTQWKTTDNSTGSTSK